MNEILIIIGLILLNGVFAMSEVALISARKSRLSTDVKKGNKSAKIALKLANYRTDWYYIDWYLDRYLFR